MLVYRIGKKKYARDLSGEGAKLFGGRWNHPGTACLYTAGSKSLCLLEYTANVSIEQIPGELCFTAIEIPDAAIHEIRISALPKNWRDFPHPKESRDFGTKILQSGKWLAIKIPSAILIDEFNYLVNPLHKLFKEVKIRQTSDYDYDLRLKK